MAETNVRHDVLIQLLENIEDISSLRARDRLALGLTCRCQGLTGIDVLHKAAAASVKGGDGALAQRCLLALSELCRELECSEYLGIIGGHHSILRTMTMPENSFGEGRDDGEEDEVQAAAAAVAASVASSGCTFPMRASSSDTASALLPMRYDFTLTRSYNGIAGARNGMRRPGQLGVTDDARSDVGQEATGREDAEAATQSISIFVRTVRERQHSQFDVGFQMWPAALILSRWLCRNPQVLEGRRVLEIGAGLGLAGIVAAHVAYEVTLSDFNPVVLRALEGNVALNFNSAGSASQCIHVECEPTGIKRSCVNRCTADAAIKSPARMHVCHLDWDKLQTQKKASSFEDPPSDERNERKISQTLIDPTSVHCTQASERRASGTPADAGEDFRCVTQGETFDVIIASDHICQTSDAEGTIRALQTLLTDDGHAFFMVAHPRTRFGVEALAPLLAAAPDLEYTCREVSDGDLIGDLEEAAYLAWLFVHVWRPHSSALEERGLSETEQTRDISPGLLIAG